MESVAAKLGGAEHAVQFGSVLRGADLFDADAFSLPAAEAALLDPQQRLLLLCAADVLLTPQLDLAQRARQGRSSTGVWVGIAAADYGRLVAQHTRAALPAYAATAGILSVAAGRISFTFDLQGPAVAVDTGAHAVTACLNDMRNTRDSWQARQMPLTL